MVEVVQNMQVEDTEVPLKGNASLVDGENLQDSSSDITYSEETELPEEKHDELNEVSNEEPQLPPSKWTTLARAFRLGLSHDSNSQSNSSKEATKSIQNDIKTMDKRGSLGKMFRHGLPHFPRPNSARDRAKSEFDLTGLSTETPQNTEKVVKWNIFKHGKSQHQVPPTPNNEESPIMKDDSKRRPLSKLLHIRSRTSKDQDTNMLGNVVGTSELLPSPETRGHSLGKFFRQNKNPKILKNIIDTSDKPVNKNIDEVADQEKQ